VAFYDFLGDGEAEAGARNGLPAAGIDAKEGLERLAEQLRRNAPSAIGDGEGGGVSAADRETPQPLPCVAALTIRLRSSRRRPSAPALTETLSRWPIETAWPSETISASMSRTSRSNSTGSTAFSSAKSYGDAARIARTLYRSGETSLLDVLDTERSLYSAEDDLLQSRVAIATDYIALNKALGGGWDGTIDTAKPEIVDVKTGPRLASEPVTQ
jgi:hypothetical protein